MMAKLPIEEAAEAHTDLTVFAAVMCLMENSMISRHGHGDEARIVRICKSAQAKALTRYDAAVARSKVSR